MKSLNKWPKFNTSPTDAPQSPLYLRLLWMAAIWAVSVLALLAVAGILRWVLSPSD